MARQTPGKGNHTEIKQQKVRQLSEVLPELHELYQQYNDAAQCKEPSELSAPLPTYSYFDSERIGQYLTIDPQTRRSAEQIIASHSYKEFRVGVVYAEDLRYRIDLPDGMLEAQEKLGIATLTQQYGYWAELIFSRNSVLQVRCNDWNCYHAFEGAGSDQKGFLLCEHEAAAWYLLREYLRKHNPGDATNQSGEQLLAMQMSHSMGDRQLIHAQSGSHTLKIEPCILWEYTDSLYVQFRIGSGRLYNLNADI